MPHPVAGQSGPTWLRWLDRYAYEHASAVETISVRDFPPMVLERIEEGEEGTATQTNLQMVIVLMVRIGHVYGLQAMPIALEEAACLTRVLVLDKALSLLHEWGIIGDYHVDEPPMGHAGLLGATLKLWLNAAVMHS